MHFVKIKNNSVCKSKNPTFYEALGREQFPFVTVQVRVKLSARVPSALRTVFVCLRLRLSKTPRNIY